MRGALKHILGLAMLLLMLSCTHKDLCYHHPHTAKVRIDADWSEFEKEVPSGMTVMVYPCDGGRAVRHLTNTITHAYVNLPVGYYHSITFNQSEEEYGSVGFRGMDRYETAEVHTNATKSTWYKTKAEEEKLAAEPEWIGADRHEGAEVTQEMVDVTGENLIAMKQQRALMQDFVIATHTPQNIIYTITVKVHLKGFHNLRSARASMTGLAEGYMFAKGEYTANQVTQLLETWSSKVDENDPTKGYITTISTCFGLPKGHGATADENLFTLSVLLVDNKTVKEFPFKVGDLIEHDGENLSLNLELSVDETLPDVQPVGGSSSGFDAKVEDWGDEENFEVEI